MFDFFKKKRATSIQAWERALLKAVVGRLPSKYSFLVNQVSSEILLDSVPNGLLGGNWKRTKLDGSIHDSIINRDLDYRLAGIRVFDAESETFKDVELDLHEGILIGYNVDGGNGRLDLEDIDVGSLREKPWDNVNGGLQEIIGKEDYVLLAQFGFKDGFEIEIPEGRFHVIKDFEDGNYLSMDGEGAVYCMMHDPYEIEKLFNGKDDFFAAMKFGEFSALEYYNKKMS